MEEEGGRTEEKQRKNVSVESTGWYIVGRRMGLVRGRSGTRKSRWNARVVHEREQCD